MCSAPKNTHILTAQTPLRKNSATFLKTIFFWDTLHNQDLSVKPINHCVRYAVYLSSPAGGMSHITSNNFTFYNITVPVFVTIFSLIFLVMVLTGGDGYIFKLCHEDKEKKKERKKFHIKALKKY